jgi:hypothetical protein
LAPPKGKLRLALPPRTDRCLRPRSESAAVQILRAAFSDHLRPCCHGPRTGPCVVESESLYPEATKHCSEGSAGLTPRVGPPGPGPGRPGFIRPRPFRVRAEDSLEGGVQARPGPGQQHDSGHGAGAAREGSRPDVLCLYYLSALNKRLRYVCPDRYGVVSGARGRRRCSACTSAVRCGCPDYGVCPFPRGPRGSAEICPPPSARTASALSCVSELGEAKVNPFFVLRE